MKKNLLLFLLLSIQLLIFADVYIAGGDVSGTWTRELSPYYIEGNITVPCYLDSNMAVLTIQPEVQIIFLGHYYLEVDGILTAVGDSEEMIVFTIADTTGFSNPDIPDGGWAGIRFPGNRNGRPIVGSEIGYCHIEYGKALGDYDDKNGGAIFLNSDTSVSIHDSEIMYNYADGSGGGIYQASSSSDLEIRNNIISYNKSKLDGGGVYIGNYAELSDNVISYNEANSNNGFGGGIYYSAYGTINGGRVSYNSANIGGGIYCSNSSPEINGVLVKYNFAVNRGGGIFCNYYTSPQIINCEIKSNSTNGNGGGFYSDYECYPNITNCLVVNNTAENYGGGYYINGSTPILKNVTFWNNTANNHIGGALYSASAADSISNCIFWEDSPDEFAVEGGTFIVTYSDVDLPSGIFPGEGNLNTNPNFRDLESEDWHLAVFNVDGDAKNPLIDAGNPYDVYDNEPMPNGHRINMGAYGNTSEATVSVHFAGGNVDGNEHWTNDEMQVVNQPITINSGALLTIDPGVMINIDNSDVQFIVHGGFRAIGGIGDTIRISPNLLGRSRVVSWPGINFSQDADNAVLQNVIIEDATDGLILNNPSTEIRHSKIIYDASGTRDTSTGKGIKVGDNSDATIDDTDVENYATGIEVSNSSPVITNTRVRNSPESTRDNEIGIEVTGESSPEIDSCQVDNCPKGIKIENNQAETTASPVITNTRVRNSPESTRQTEVGIEISGSAAVEAKIQNCDIEDYPYGIEYIGNGEALRTTPTLTNNRLRNSPESTRNTTLVKGIYLENLATSEIDNCTIEYYPTAIQIANNTRFTSHPVITNTRVRNSPESTRENYVGLKFSGDIYANVNENEFVNCDSALVTLGVSTNGDFNHNLIYMNVASPIDVAFYAENSNDITFTENTVNNYDYGFYANGATASLENNIIWNSANSIYNINGSSLAVNYNDVQGGYPSRNNLDEDPLFVDIVGENFYLLENSPCIDAGNPASEVPENGGLRIDIGRFEYTDDTVVKTISGGTKTFGKSKVKMELVNGSGTFTVTHHNSNYPATSYSVSRYETIELDSGTPTINLTLYYEDSQLNGQDETDLKIWKNHNGVWTKLGADARDLDENWVMVNGVSEFSDFLLSDAETEDALPISLSSFTAALIENTPTLFWTTQSEVDNIGWNVYRSESGSIDNSLQINPQIIPGAGTTSEETSYEYTDANEVIPDHSYYYWLESVNASSETSVHGPITLTIPGNGEEQFPEYTALFGNYPNPFNSGKTSTQIKFAIQKNDETGVLSIYNVKGQLVFKKEFDAGTYNYNWKADNYASGIYFYKLKTDSYESIRKMIILK